MSMNLKVLLPEFVMVIEKLENSKKYDQKIWISVFNKYSKLCHTKIYSKFKLIPYITYVVTSWLSYLIELEIIWRCN